MHNAAAIVIISSSSSLFLFLLIIVLVLFLAHHKHRHRHGLSANCQVGSLGVFLRTHMPQPPPWYHPPLLRTHDPLPFVTIKMANTTSYRSTIVKQSEYLFRVKSRVVLMVVELIASYGEFRREKVICSAVILDSLFTV